MCPKVSVVMSAYNENEHILVESINSILSQTFQDLEIIFVNDNPQNALIDKVVKELNDDRIVYLKNEINMGLVNSLNRGLSVAKGKYIARMDADDISDLSRIEKQLKYLEENKLDLVGCAIQYIDEDGNSLNKGEIFPSDIKKIKRRNRWKQCFAHPTFFVKRSVYNELNGYRHIDCCEDYDFICRCIFSGYKVGNLNESLLYYRIRKDGISSSKMYDQKVRSFYIGNLKEKVISTPEKKILEFFESKEYQKELKLCSEYFLGKEMIKSRKPNKILIGIIKMLNKYFVYAVMRKIYD